MRTYWAMHAKVHGVNEPKLLNFATPAGGMAVMWGYWRRIGVRNGGNSTQNVRFAGIRNAQCGGHYGQ